MAKAGEPTPHWIRHAVQSAHTAEECELGMPPLENSSTKKLKLRSRNIPVNALMICAKSQPDTALIKM